MGMKSFVDRANLLKRKRDKFLRWKDKNISLYKSVEEPTSIWGTPF